MYATIIYAVFGLITAAKAFETLIRHEVKTWGEVDAVDVGFMSVISIMIGTIFPLVLLALFIYNVILQPIVVRINEEKNNV